MIYFIISFKNLRSSVDLVRERICDLTSRILTAINRVDLTKPGEIDSHLFSQIQTSLVERFRDSNERVQHAAIRASASLQEPHNKLCPVMSELIFLLKSDSNRHTRLLILDLIVINKQVFNLIKSELFYDTDAEIRHKSLSLLYKKLPNKFVDAKLKKQILDCLLRDKNTDLIEQFMLKWADGKTHQLIDALSLSNFWYADFDSSEINYQHKKLTDLMHVYYKCEKLMLVKIAHLNERLAEQRVFDCLNLAFQFSSLVSHADKLNKLDFLVKHLIIGLDQFELDLLRELESNNANRSKTLILFHLLNAYAKLNTSFDAYKYLKLIEYSNESCECLLGLLVSKISREEHQTVVLDLIRMDEINEKCLSVLSFVLGQYDEEDFGGLDAVLDTDMNMIEYLVTHVLAKSITHLSPTVRALSVRCLGLACLTCQYIAQSYIEFLTKVSLFFV